MWWEENRSIEIEKLEAIQLDYIVWRKRKPVEDKAKALWIKVWKGPE